MPGSSNIKSHLIKIFTHNEAVSDEKYKVGRGWVIHQERDNSFIK